MIFFTKSIQNTKELVAKPAVVEFVFRVEGVLRLKADRQVTDIVRKSLRCLFVPWDRLVLLGIGHQSPHL